MSTEVTTLAQALDLICYGDTAAEAQEGHRYLLTLEAYKRWAEDVAKPALERINDRSLRIIAGEIETGAVGAADYNCQVVERALAAYPQPVEETQP